MLGKHVGSMKGQTEVKAIPSEYGMPKLETTGAVRALCWGIQFSSWPPIRPKCSLMAPSTASVLTPV